MGFFRRSRDRAATQPLSLMPYGACVPIAPVCWCMCEVLQTLEGARTIEVRFLGRIHRNCDPVPSLIRVRVISARGLATASITGPPSTFVTMVPYRTLPTGHGHTCRS